MICRISHLHAIISLYSSYILLVSCFYLLDLLKMLTKNLTKNITMN